MATGQTLLDTIELLKPELQLQSGEQDVTRGLVALNRAQDAFESQYAQYPGAKGSGVGTVTTSANTETTTFPSGLLRIDSLWMLDSNGRQQYELDDPSKAGSQTGASIWPWNQYLASSGTGKPVAFYTNGTNIYWNPIPDAVYTIRYYGFTAASDITASGTFAYDDIFILPLATFAVKLISIGLDDKIEDISALSDQVFSPAIDTAQGFNRTGPQRLTYRYRHDT